MIGAWPVRLLGVALALPSPALAGLAARDVASAWASTTPTSSPWAKPRFSTSTGTAGPT
jgi:hypothetical protein